MVSILVVKRLPKVRENKRYEASLRVLFQGISFQKQPSIGVLTKKCSEKMQQIYRKTPMSKWNFNKVANQVGLSFNKTF